MTTEQLAEVGRALKRQVSRMSRADPTICVWLDALSAQAAAMEKNVWCDHKRFKGGSGNRGNDGWVYVVSAPGTGLVKIGCCGPRLLDKRLRTLQGNSPVRLELIALATGGTQLEAHWHNEFKRHRRHVEWFDASEIEPMFRTAMAESPDDGCARCVLMNDRLPVRTLRPLNK